MANRYWVGGAGTWNTTSTTNWSATSGGASGASVPTSADSVFFDQATTYTVTLTGAINCLDFTVSAGTVTFIDGTSTSLSIYGSFSIVAATVWTSTIAIIFLAVATGKTVTTNGVNIASTLAFQNAAGGWALGSALTCASITLNSGALSTSASNYAITATNSISGINITGTGVKTLTLNASTITLGGGLNAFVYSGSNLTFSAGTSSIVFTNLSPTLSGGGLTFNNVSFTNTATGSTQSTNINGANTFAQLSISSISLVAGVKVIAFGANQTITTLVCAGASATKRILLSSDTPKTARTITVTTYTLKSDVDFRDITAVGGTPWSGTRLGNCLGNTNITFVAGKTVYWNLTGSENWSSTAWATTSGGVPAVNNFPLAQDTAVIDNTGAATTIALNSQWNIGVFSTGIRTTAVTITNSAPISVYGDWVTGTGVTLSVTSSTKFMGVTTLTSAGETFAGISIYGGSVTLADALISSGSLSILYSAASLSAVSYAVTASTVTFVAGTSLSLGTAGWTITGTGSVWSATGTLTKGSANITLSNTSTTARTFSGGNNTYNKLIIGGSTGTSALTIVGSNTFSEIASTKTVAHSILFTSGTTTTVGAWTVLGSVGNVVTIGATTTSAATLAYSGAGIVSANYLSISYSTATPTNTWYATNSTDGGNNSGWIFTAASNNNGNMLMMFS